MSTHNEPSDFGKRGLLSFLKEASSADRSRRAELLRTLIGPVGEGRRVCVWFNAWKYQSSSEVWAGLAYAILTQVEAQMTPAQGAIFRLALEAKRVRYSELRYRAIRAAVIYALPFISVAIAAAVSAAVLDLLGIDPISARATILTVGSSGVVAAFGRARRFLKVNPQRAEQELVENPSYESRLGFFHIVEQDVRDAVALVAVKGRPLVIFIDDLDRCRDQTVAEVVEAINTFLAGDFGDNCIFIIGMEPEVVAAHIETAYERVAAALVSAGTVSRFGWHFLVKMVQLPISLPPPGRAEIDQYVASLLVDEGTDDMGSEERRDDLQQKLEEHAPELAELEEIVRELERQGSGSASVTPSLDAARAAITYAASRLDDKHPNRARGYQSRNPASRT